MTAVSLPDRDVYSGDCPSRTGTLAAGDVIDGKYEVVAFLGAGGMGSVWRAHCRALDVDVAVKILHRHLDGSSERLHREARATAQIGHPAIVRALDFGAMATGEPFLVMEYLEGGSLADWLRARGPMPAEQAVQLLLPVADGLAAAHARGIVHRDVKPENIHLVPDRNGAQLPKILDFGIAKMDPVDGAVITQEGAVMGSPRYMAPEQAMGERVTPQVDVWALTVVLYELITGASPFPSATTAGLLMAIQSKAPRPAPELTSDPVLWAIVQRGLEKSLERRWPTMRELGHALAAWAIDRGLVTDTAGASIEHVWMDRAGGGRRSVPQSEDRSSGPGALPTAMTMNATLPSNRAAESGGKVPSLPEHETSPGPVAGVLPVASRIRRALRSTAMGLVTAMTCVPLLGVAGFYAHGRAIAGTPDGSPPALAAAPLSAPPAELTVAAPPSPATRPDVVAGPAPSAAVATAVPEARRAPAAATTDACIDARAGRKAPAVRSKPLAQAMPFPATPDF